MDKPVIKIKYFDEKYGTKLPRLAKIKQGDWIDVYAAENVSLKVGERAIIPLGIAMELPEGYEAYVLPRSSTAKKFGIIMANSMGIIDNSYCGDNDEWGFVAYCIGGSGNKYTAPVTDYIGEDGQAIGHDEDFYSIAAGDRIGQFRIQKKMEDIEFEEVEHLNNEDRGGFGSTGTR